MGGAPDGIIIMPAVTGQSFHDALRAAEKVGAHAFHDPETMALIPIMPGTSFPGAWGMAVRHLRLEEQRKARKWYRRLLRWVIK